MNETNLLRTGAAFLADRLSRHAAERVHYLRSAAVTEMPAVLGGSDFDVDQGDGSMLRVHAHDFVIRADQLLLDGIPVEPEEGDRIIVGTLGAGEVYEVMGIPGEPAWRYTDEHRYAYRIHTKHVESQD